MSEFLLGTFVASLLLSGAMWGLEAIACDGIVLLLFLIFVVITWLILDKKSMVTFCKSFPQEAPYWGVLFGLVLLAFVVRILEFSPMTSIGLVILPIF